MSKYNKLHKPSFFGFKNKTRGGYRAYIFRTDSTNKKGRIAGVVLEGEQVTVRTWKDNGGYYTSGLASPYDLIPLKDKKAHFEDLTKINVPFGDLDKDTQKRLKEWPHGIEAKNGWCGWVTITASFDSEDMFYRAIPVPVEKPKPEYEVGRWYPWGGGECPVPNKTRTSVLLAKDGVITDSDPEGWNWGDTTVGNDILAFKVVSYA